MLAGLTELSDSFQLPLLDARELAEVFLQLRLDHPANCSGIGISFPSLSGYADLLMTPSIV